MLLWIAAAVLLLYFIYLRAKRPSAYSLLPGPPQRPLVGNALDLDHEIYRSFQKWAEKYGPIFYCKLLHMRVIVLSSEDLVKKAFSGEKYRNVMNEKPKTFAAKYVQYNFRNIVGAENTKETFSLRKWVHKGLNLYGDGITKFECIVEEELQRLIKEIDGFDGKDFNPRPVIQTSLGNLISILLCGEGTSRGDSQLIWEYVEAMNEFVKPDMDMILMSFPFLRFCPGRPGRLFRMVMERRDKLIHRFYDTQKSTHIPGNERGLVDVMMDIQKQERDNGATWFVDEYVKGVILDMILTGLVTTSNAMMAFLLILLNNEFWMKKLVKEIDDVIGPYDKPTLKHRQNMPISEAVFTELIRYIAHVPCSFPRRVTQDIDFEGYRIPKETLIFACFWNTHHDPKVWKDPWKFDPSRFLDENEQMVSSDHPNRQHLIIFGSGRRNCLGENLAKSRIFLYMSTLLQKYDLLPPVDNKLPSDDPRGYKGEEILMPPAFSIRAIPKNRHKEIVESHF